MVNESEHTKRRSLATFRGTALLAHIGVRPTPCIGQTPGINLTEYEVSESDQEDQEDQEDKHAFMPVGFAANFGTGNNSGSYFWSIRKKARTYKKAIPEWVFSNSKIGDLVQRSFPNWRNNPRMHDDAARWVAVINLYYRNGYTFSQIAEEICSTTCKVRGVIRSIQRAARGLQANSNKARTNNRGKNPRSRRKPGKPRLFSTF